MNKFLDFFLTWNFAIGFWCGGAFAVAIGAIKAL